MFTDTESRKAVKKLLKLSNQFQAHAMSLDETLKTIIRLPGVQASMSRDDVRNLIQEARNLADEEVSQSTAFLMRTLESDTPWQHALLTYVSMFLKGE